MVEDNFSMSPVPEIEIGLNISIEVSKCILQSNPLVPYFMPEKETCELQFQIDIWKSEFLVFRLQWLEPDNVPLQMKCLFLDYVQLLMIAWVIQVMKVDWNAKNGPLSHQKMKCSFLDYIQLLMISQVIQVMKANQNAKRPPKSSNNEMLIFGLHSTSDDWLSDLSDESWPKCKKWLLMTG